MNKATLALGLGLLTSACSTTPPPQKTEVNCIKDGDRFTVTATQGFEKATISVVNLTQAQEGVYVGTLAAEQPGLAGEFDGAQFEYQVTPTGDVCFVDRMDVKNFTSITAPRRTGMK